AFLRHELERRFDDQLGLRTRNHHRWRYLEVESPELLATHDVCERLAGEAAGDERLITRNEACGHGLVRGNEKMLARPSEGVLRQQPRVELGELFRQAGVAQPDARRGDVAVDGLS